MGSASFLSMTFAMRRLLFVDDDVAQLSNLRETLAGMRDEWHMEFARSGEEALDILARAPFEILFTDLGLPGMDGLQLLAEVMNRHPDMVRIALLARADEGTVVRTAGATHQYLAKPCDLELLKRTVSRAAALRSLLTDESLRNLVRQVRSLPSLPALYTRLVEECRSPRGSLKTIGEIIEDDVGMTAKILHLINSAFFGLRCRVTSPVQAVQLLGLDTVKSLVLCASVFSQFEGKRLGRFSMVTFWRHSLITGSFARIIAAQERQDQHFANDASVAGLLHDAGQLILASSLPERYDEALGLAAREGLALSDAELRVFGTTHAAVGAYLLGHWGLADAIVEAVAFHHMPMLEPDRAFAALTAVHVADALAHEFVAVGETSGGVDHAYLEDLGLTERLPVWRERCQAFAAETRTDA